MNILEALHSNGINTKRVAMTHGGEYHSPCPMCGGVDRFICWPGRKEFGTWYCRQCKKGGDTVTYMMDIHSMRYTDACKTVGKKLQQKERFSTPENKKTGDQSGWKDNKSQKTEQAAVAKLEWWRSSALKLVGWAHSQLLLNDPQLDWLVKRGITIDTVKRFKLGWIPEDIYRPREAWGLKPDTNNEGKEKKVWIPRGLVIPGMTGGYINKIKIRRPTLKTGEPRFIIIPGSSSSPIEITATGKDKDPPAVIVESELDGILIVQAAGDIVTVIALGSCSIRPNYEQMDRLVDKPVIIYALDYDDAGFSSWIWWKKNFHQVKYWPTPEGKDPGEYFKDYHGDIRAWIIAGLPPIYKMMDQDKDNFKSEISNLKLYSEEKCTVIEDAKGREINITDDKRVYDTLTDAGEIVLNNREVRIVEKYKNFASTLIDVKKIFGGEFTYRNGMIKMV